MEQKILNLFIYTVLLSYRIFFSGIKFLFSAYRVFFSGIDFFFLVS